MSQERKTTVRSLYLQLSDKKLEDQSIVHLEGWVRSNRDNGSIGFIEFNDGSSYKVDLKNINDKYIESEKDKKENITVKITKSEKTTETPLDEININEIKDSTPTPKKRVRRQIKSN